MLVTRLQSNGRLEKAEVGSRYTHCHRARTFRSRLDRTWQGRTDKHMARSSGYLHHLWVHHISESVENSSAGNHRGRNPSLRGLWMVPPNVEHDFRSLVYELRWIQLCPVDSLPPDYPDWRACSLACQEVSSVGYLTPTVGPCNEFGSFTLSISGCSFP